MLRNNLFIVFILLLCQTQAIGQQMYSLKRNLQQDWLVYHDNQYKEFKTFDEPVSTIYFLLPATAYRSDFLEVSSKTPFSILINNTLCYDKGTHVRLSIDSLKEIGSESSILVAVHQEKNISYTELTTDITTKTLVRSGDVEDSFLREKTMFRDFSITAIVLLVIFIVSIIRLNPGLSSDYFSIFKIFSFRESEDDHHYYRVTSGTILFYVFTSMLLAFYGMIVTRYSEPNMILNFNIVVASYWMIFLTWIKISAVILVLLFIKISVIYLSATLFGIREVAGYHFFNFVRLLLISISILTVLLTGYFVLHGQSEGFYNFLYTSFQWVLGGWIILSFFKLANRVHRAPFHLFSYICATELLPFLIIVKVLNE